MEQESLTDPAQPAKRRVGDGLYSRFVFNGLINQSAWLRAVGSYEVVGSCRDCGGDLHAGRPIGRGEGGSDPDYPMECADCKKEFVSPRGRTLRWKGERGKKRPLPQGMVSIAKDAAGVGQNRDDD